MDAREVLDKTAPVDQASCSWFLKAALVTSRCRAFCYPRACPPPVPRWYGPNFNNEMGDEVGEWLLTFWLRLRSAVVDNFTLTLVRKLDSNSFASWLKDETEWGFSWLYHIQAVPRRVVGNARHISARPCTGHAIQRHLCSKASDVLHWVHTPIVGFQRGKPEAYREGLILYLLKFYVVVEESVAWFRHVRKLVRVGREEVRKPKKGLSGLRCASWEVCLRMELLGGSHEVLHKSLIGMEDT
ncbi:hypothetical protein B296_00051970 [Ensete ventricosum]|uniref:Uncharacterized protein n=1 Tax=Ensete ventricosum TaxID=4639 RepID=A0A426X3Z8_ENSVE|nr:hypothetical protein B296_00051970 [Ensete ventricosum]